MVTHKSNSMSDSYYKKTIQTINLKKEKKKKNEIKMEEIERGK